MADPFIGEIRAFAFNYTPQNWLPCDGQTVSRSYYSTLFSVIGNNFGGNGTTTFALPNLNGRTPIGQGQGNGMANRIVGENLGSESEALTFSHLPNHAHRIPVSTVVGNSASPKANNLAIGANRNALYTSASNASDTLNGSTIQVVGNGAPHNNMQPYLALNFCICYSGEYPVYP
jgi:microcystin-dependent protein